MANPLHVAKAMEGRTAWERWRDDNPELVIDLSGAELKGQDFCNANLSRVNFNDADLSQTDLWEADLSEASLCGAIFQEADLRKASLVRSNLTGIDLRWAKLSQADLSGSVLRNALLVGANLRNARLAGAELAGADLCFADLTMAHLRNADVTGAKLGWTILADSDLHGANGLSRCQHVGPSSVGIDTFFRSGAIPETFLRGCGVPDSFTTFASSLVIQPVQFYSCFISYSSKDVYFAERLHADLQAKGVRCWFAPEALRVGDKLRCRIDESIRIHDKLLLVLSEHSILSSWVEDEVESALARERKERRPKLFPIRLDDSIMQTDVAWAAHILQKRHIGNFSGWKDHDKYRRAIERLLSDLKAESAPQT